MLSIIPFGVLTLKAKESSKKHSNVITRADELFDSNKMTELLEYLKTYQDSDSAGVQWRLARAYYKVSNLSTTVRDDAERLAYKAEDHITKALELDSDSFACHEVGRWLCVSIADAAPLCCDALREHARMGIFTTRCKFRRDLKSLTFGLWIIICH